MVGRALVTGSAGFIGHHVTDRLLGDGWTVDECDLVPGPNRPGMDCRRMFATNAIKYDLVVHCAAVVGGRAKIEGAPMAVAENLSIDSALWQWALHARPGRIVYWSSSAAYPTWLQNGRWWGSLAEDSIDLDEIEQPDATYGLAKLVGEVQAELVRAEGVPVTVLRPFSGWGEDQSRDYPMPSFLDRAARREDPFSIWGDGQQVRDWIHVDDIVGGMLAAVEADVEVSNLCTGVPTSFLDLAELVCAQARYVPELAFHLDAPQGVRYRVGDPTLMRSFYEPRVSLEEGVARALAARAVA